MITIAILKLLHETKDYCLVDTRQFEMFYDDLVKDGKADKETIFRITKDLRMETNGREIIPYECGIRIDGKRYSECFLPSVQDYNYGPYILSIYEC